MEPNAQKGQDFMKAVVKASLWGLFAIGVRSQTNLDKFIAAFTDKLDKSFKELGMIKDTTTLEVAVNNNVIASQEVPMVESSLGQEAVPPSEPLIDTIIENTMILKALKKEGITKVSDLVLEMSKRDLKEIKGIGDKAVIEIRKKISQWNG